MKSINSIFMHLFIFIIAIGLLPTVEKSAIAKQKIVFTTYHVIQENCDDCWQRCGRISEDIKMYTADGWLVSRSWNKDKTCLYEPARRCVCRGEEYNIFYPDENIMNSSRKQKTTDRKPIAPAIDFDTIEGQMKIVNNYREITGYTEIIGYRHWYNLDDKRKIDLMVPANNYLLKNEYPEAPLIDSGEEYSKYRKFNHKRQLSGHTEIGPEKYIERRYEGIKREMDGTRKQRMLAVEATHKREIEKRNTIITILAVSLIIVVFFVILYNLLKS